MNVLSYFRKLVLIGVLLFTTLTYAHHSYYYLRSSDALLLFSHLISDPLTKEKLFANKIKKTLFVVDDKISEAFKTYLTHQDVDYNHRILKPHYDQNDIAINVDHHFWSGIPKSLNLPPSLQYLIDWENHSNEFIKNDVRHSPLSFKLLHYAIPYETVESDIASYFDPEILQSLTFEEDGVKWIRWPMNPEDGIYYGKLENYLKKNHIPFKKQYYYYGFLMASRSLMVFDPITKKIFSLKASTNFTAGPWKLKPLKRFDIHEARKISDYLHGIFSKRGSDEMALSLLYESAGFTLPHFDFGFIVREYPQKILMPAFAIQHCPSSDQFYKDYHSPLEESQFWKINFNHAFAKATAEFIAYSGLSFSSAHSQQQLLELDEQMHFTGKIYFRDLNDVFSFKAFFQPSKSELQDFYMKDLEASYKLRYFKLIYAFFQNFKPGCSWQYSSNEWEDVQKEYRKKRVKSPLFVKKVDEWTQDYIDSFSTHFKKLTDIHISFYKQEMGRNGTMHFYAKIYKKPNSCEILPEWISWCEKGVENACYSH